MPGIAHVPQSHNRYTYALGNPIIFVDPSGLVYMYCQLSGGAYTGTGGSADIAVYLDPITGEGAIVISAGVGVGFGGGLSGEIGVVKDMPRPGFSVNAKVSGGGGTVKGSTSGNLGTGLNTGTELSASATVRYNWVEVSWSDWEDFYRHSILYPELGYALSILESQRYVIPPDPNRRPSESDGWGSPPSRGK